MHVRAYIDPFTTAVVETPTAPTAAAATPRCHHLVLSVDSGVRSLRCNAASSSVQIITTITIKRKNV